MRDQRALDFVDSSREIVDFPCLDVEIIALLGDYGGKCGLFVGIFAGAPAIDHCLEIGKAL